MKTVQFLAIQAALVGMVALVNLPLAAAQIAVKAGLQIYYPMDGNANDLSGEANDGTSTSLTFGDDRLGFPGKAGNFNGTSSIIRSAFPANITSDFTMAAWVYPRSFPTGANLWTLFGVEANFNLFINAGFSGDSIGFQFENGSGRQPILGRNVLQRQNTWFHLCVVRRPTTQNLFINGVLVRSSACAAGSVSGITNPWFVGGSPLLAGFGFGGYFDGLMDEFRLYNRAINQAEVDTLSDNWPVGNRASLAKNAYGLLLNGSEVVAHGLADGDILTVYSLEGKQIAKASASGGKAGARMPKNGIYMIAIVSKKGLWTKRVIVQ